MLLAERSRVGGTCVNYGCTPTKTLVASARAAHVARSAGRLGIRAGAVEVDFAAVMARKDAIVRQWREGVERRIEKAGAEAAASSTGTRASWPSASSRSPASGTRAEVVVLNVGTRPVPPPIPGAEAVPWLDNRRVMELDGAAGAPAGAGRRLHRVRDGQLFRRLGAG